MAIVRIPAVDVVLRQADEIRTFLDRHLIDFEQWTPNRPLKSDASADEVLHAYAPEVDALKQRGGYATADVIDVKPETPNLDAMLARFNREHWHDEDEVRFIVEGRGIFHVHPDGEPVFAIEVEAGDLIRVPRGTHHWFDLCADRRIRAIRLFMDPAGWAPHYTESGVDQGFQPVCFGPAYVAPRA
jgi:1,2-dihydroxy-3-keto-5-methylthiopentene dioxygenase